MQQISTPRSHWNSSNVTFVGGVARRCDWAYTPTPGLGSSLISSHELQAETNPDAWEVVTGSYGKLSVQHQRPCKTPFIGTIRLYQQPSGSDVSDGCQHRLKCTTYSSVTFSTLLNLSVLPLLVRDVRDRNCTCSWELGEVEKIESNAWSLDSYDQR